VEDVAEEEKEEVKAPKYPVEITTGAFMKGKKENICEDAYFIQERSFGVADGVSGWNDYGFSSSAFSTNLMKFCKEEIETYLEKGVQAEESKKMMKQLHTVRSQLSMENFGMDDEEESESDISEEEAPVLVENNPQVKDNMQFDIHPTYILDKAFSRVKNVGSATAMMGILNKNKISFCNLGDSGFAFIRIRNGEAFTFARSNE
jgi:serine/threonine protein phosphatase PrpC